MDTQRLILFMGLFLVLFMIWQEWQRENAPTPPPVASHTSTQPPGAAPIPNDGATAQPGGVEAPPADVPTAPASAEPAHFAETSGPIYPSAGRIRVHTDVYTLEIDRQGGDLRALYLNQYPESSESKAKDQPFRLLNDQLPNVFIAQSGLKDSQGNRLDYANAIYTSAQDSYQLSSGANELTVPLTRKLPNGLTVTKTYTFHRNSYVINVQHRLDNQGEESWKGAEYRLLERTQVPTKSDFNVIHTYTGAVIYTPEDKYQKIDFEAIHEGELRNGKTVQGGWTAMIQHYFLAAWIPSPSETDLFYTRERPTARYVIGQVGPAQIAAPGASVEFQSRLFVGPKLQDQLASVAPGLELTADYGILTVIAKPVFWLLEQIHRFVGNWGIAIILVTVLIKALFYKLSETSYRSMANMRRMQPRLKALKERYGDDKQKLNQAMMDLYKTEKINPLGGCLPILVQIPVFIALYWVLLESVELRHAPFFGWITDLSAHDPYYILPIIMGLSMFIQQRLNPAPLDPLQQKVMMVLPLVFTVFFLQFPSGLVLYWVVNNILSIAQQWVITKRIEEGAKPS